ncbi:HNH endonuclease signature motif containing protein [Tsukamurella pseudospumae]|uniref:DUF222 domain-containing protein n=1 Tax=Tsukamurella pseudospumae TaxID=239498 RepID=A0A137YXA8_9ACTN|nr:HNH endonuclease signature motif containing protein [Tsukamurella pseudospumae]KXO90585.1 hypothetical protein AXK61_08245 [Tsukamurella pseudospumae]
MRSPGGPPANRAVSPDIQALAVIVLNETDLFDATSTDDDLFTPEPAPEVTPEPAPEVAPEPDSAPTPTPDAEPDSEAAAARGAVVLTGDPGITGPVTVEQARELIAQSRTQFRVLGRRDPATGTVHARGASGYRPTWYQLLVMRLTYPTCVFPGYSVAADRCQADHVGEYDHTDPAAGGPTTVAGRGTSGNLVPLCGFHHRIKTETGWLSDILQDGTVEWRHPAGGIWTVPPGTARDLLPGLGLIIWDGPEPGPARTKNPDGLESDAKRRATARRALRIENRLLRHERRGREAAEAEARERERECREAEAQGRTYDVTAPLKPPPF